MTKAEIKKYLKANKEEALRKINREENKLREDAKIEIAEILLADVDTVHIEELTVNLYSALWELLGDFAERFQGKCYIPNSVQCIVSQLKRLDNIGLLEYIRKDVNFKDYNMPGFEARREEITEEFAKLEGNIAGMTGKEATTYLEKLGFILPENSRPTHAILAPINMSVFAGVIEKC